MLKRRDIRKQPKFSCFNRFAYLDKLKEEFLKTKVLAARQEVIANLANFSYNPENFEHMYCLSMHQVFIDNIDSLDDFIATACIKALCNLAPHPPVGVFLNQNNIIDKILNCTRSKRHLVDFVISALLLFTQMQSIEIELRTKIDGFIRYISSELTDPRVRNYCHIITQINNNKYQNV